MAGDTVDLHIQLDPYTSLVMLSQGSTKIFKTPNPDTLSKQHITADIHSGAALCYIPDPVQPFKNSAFVQNQIYRIHAIDANLCVCDWVCCGRVALGEEWDFWKYGSKNEIWEIRDDKRPRLLLRDNQMLDCDMNNQQASLKEKMDHVGAYGTLILRGPVFESLGRYFLREFEAMPRIGEKIWDDEPSKNDVKDPTLIQRIERGNLEQKFNVLWTAAHVRGFVMIKFSAVEVEGVKQWLLYMLRDEGSIEKRFGERALMCLR